MGVTPIRSSETSRRGGEREDARRNKTRARRGREAWSRATELGVRFRVANPDNGTGNGGVMLMDDTEMRKDSDEADRNER